MANATYADVQEARAILRHHGRSFHFASHVLGSRHGGRAARLYALCRAIDDLADDAPDPVLAEARLAELSQALHAGRACDPISAAAFKLASETGLDISALQSLIDGVRSDLHPVAIADEAALIDYAYAVAGTVGLMMCAVLDVKDPRAAPFAIDLGIAMQLTNIARDVSADARLGRRYLPASWAGATEPAALVEPAGSAAQATRLSVQRMLALADQYYESGEKGLSFLPGRARLAILIAARVYRAIGRQLARQNHEPWKKRAVVPTGQKLMIALGACAAHLVNPRFHTKPAPHDARLHAAIQDRPGANPGEARAWQK